MAGTPGVRWFRAGAITLLVFAIVHGLAIYEANFAEPRTDAARAVKQAARAHQAQLGPFLATAWGGMQILNTSYSILLCFVGLLDLVAVKDAAAPRVRTLAAVNMGLAAALAGVALLYQFPPPAVFALAALVCFTIAWRRTIRVSNPA
ncbi:MAG: hypothetical protein AB7Q17_10920 [Phycisphaerae bacterium]